MAASRTPGQPEQPPFLGASPAGGRSAFPIKWLVSGGAGVALAVVIVVVVLLLIGGGDGSSDVLAYIPGNAGWTVIFNNQAALQGDVPEDYLEHLEEASEADDGSFGISSAAYDAIDIDDDEVAVYAVAGSLASNRPSLEIVKGDFQYDIIREELEDGLDCKDDDYRGYELWECPGSAFPAVALFEDNGIVVFAVARPADLEQMLTYKSRTPERLADADDSELKEILAQAGGGWLQFAFITDDCIIERCEGLAFALQNSDDSDAIPAAYAVKFRSERAAANAKDDIAIDDFLEGILAGFALDLGIGEVEAKGEFVVGSGAAEFVKPASRRAPAQRQPAPVSPATPIPTLDPFAGAQTPTPTAPPLR